MKPYPKYKDSGVEWLGDVPEGWEVKKLKYLTAKIGSGVTPKGGANVYQLSGIPLLRSQNIHFDGFRLDDVAYISGEVHNSMSGSKVLAGDVLLNITGASIGRCCFVDSELGEANVNQHVCIVRPEGQLDGQFLNYYFQSVCGQTQIELGQTGGGREGLNFEVLSRFFVSSLERGEQTTITKYLDRKTAEIDRLIANKERLVELYEEEKTAVINQAVTKGLDHDAPMKPSGIDWLGDVPEHWRLAKLKRISNKITDGEHISPTFTLDGMPFLSAKDIRDEHINSSVDKCVSFEDGIKFRKRCNPEKGDVLLVSRGATIGRVAQVETDKEFCLLGSVILIKPNSDTIEGLFLLYSLKNKLLQEDFMLTSQASAQQAIYLVSVAEVFLAVPDKKEQYAIIQHIKRECSRLDTIIEKFKKQIELLKEYRTTLISEVVTGKIDVRDEVLQ